MSSDFVCSRLVEGCQALSALRKVGYNQATVSQNGQFPCQMHIPVHTVNCRRSLSDEVANETDGHCNHYPGFRVVKGSGHRRPDQKHGR